MGGKVPADGGGAEVKQGVSPAAPTYANEIEREVAQVFTEMLQVKRVLPEDNVFTLGGDSFEAVRIALELEYRFNVEFPVEMLETSGRVCDLAAWIHAQRGSVSSKLVTPA